MFKKIALPAFIIGGILSPLFYFYLSAASAAPVNLIKNPSAETGGVLPDFWSTGNWGTNTVAFSYPTPGIDGTRAMRIDVSSITDGDAKWYFEDVSVKPNTSYLFSESYQSSVDTEAVVRYKTTGGATNYVSLGTVSAGAAPTIKQFTFTTPADASSATIFHLIKTVGYLVTDNYSLSEKDATPPPPPSSNLITNGSFETAGTGGNPSNWARGGWGTNTALFTYPNSGQDGNKAAKVQITAYTDGDAKWYFDEVPVTAGAFYTFTGKYKSTVATELVAQYRVGTGFSYQFIASKPVAAGWTTFTHNLTAPAGATSVSIFHLLSSVGTLETDEFSLISNSTPPDTTLPVANITTPNAGAILSGTASVSVTATDNVAVAGVTLLVDGAPIGAEDTVAPYTFTFDTTLFSNSSHTLTARARDTSGNLGTGAGVAVTISNGPPVTPGFETEAVASGLILPTAMAFASDGRIFIAEKGGTIRTVKNGTLLTEPLITLTDVNTYNDRGLIGIAADPNFSQNGYLYVSYTYENTPGANFSGPKTAHVARITVVGDTASESSKVILVGTVDGDAAHPSCENFLVTDDCIPSDSPSHSAGGLRFGPDGKLYATLGEGANFDRVDTLALRAQNLDSLGGKMLRLNPDGTAPSDNPFYNGNPNSNRSKVYAYGLRNAFRFNFRPSDGALFLGDVGWDTWEEINLVLPGKNYGWPCREATSNSAPASGGPGYVCDAPGALDPLYFYHHNSAFAGAVVAGAFPSGNAYPAEYSNSLFFGDYAQDLIKRLVLDGSNNVLSVQQDVIDNPGGPVDLSTGPDGNIYYLAIYTGELKRLVYTTGNRNPHATISGTPTAGVAPLSVNFSSAGSNDPNGDALSYSWNFGDGVLSGLANPSHVYSTNGIYQSVLTLSDGRGGVDIKSITITVGNRPPTANIENPASGSLYRVGDTLTAQGTGTDPENGALPLSAYHWKIILHHNTHTHLLQEFFNTASPSFAAPDHSGETDVYTEIVLTVVDSAGLTGTRSINLYLNNGTGDTSGNLVKNPSMETVDPNNGENPLYWTTSYYGDSNATFTYPVSGFEGTKGATVQVTGYVSGGAKWYFDPVYVTPGQEYHFSDYYTATSNSSLTAEFGFADGTYRYVDLATLPPVATPTRVDSTIIIPANVQRLSVTHELAGNGTLTTDNFSLTLGGTTPPPPPPPPPTSSNLITNGSFETAGTGGNPLGWTRGGWGDQTVLFTYPIVGFDGGKAVELKITAYPPTGGDSKWVFEDVLVNPGTLYTYSERYQANTISDVIGQYTMNDNSQHYFGLTKELPPTTGWTSNSGSFCPPTGTKSITLFHLLSTITNLSLDDVSLTAGGSCTPAETIPPTVAFTNPVEGNTVSGLVTLNANATDNVGVTQFFFAVDGDPFGPIMPTGPYTINWDSTSVPNGAHTLKATATDAAGNNERQIINITVNNP
jgi:glucose/arabinose dehydrogenase